MCVCGGVGEFDRRKQISGHCSHHHHHHDHSSSSSAPSVPCTTAVPLLWTGGQSRGWPGPGHCHLGRQHAPPARVIVTCVLWRGTGWWRCLTGKQRNATCTGREHRIVPCLDDAYDAGCCTAAVVEKGTIARCHAAHVARRLGIAHACRWSSSGAGGLGMGVWVGGRCMQLLAPR